MILFIASRSVFAVAISGALEAISAGRTTRAMDSLPSRAISSVGDSGAEVVPSSSAVVDCSGGSTGVVLQDVKSRETVSTSASSSTADHSFLLIFMSLFLSTRSFAFGDAPKHDRADILFSAQKSRGTAPRHSIPSVNYLFIISIKAMTFKPRARCFTPDLQN